MDIFNISENTANTIFSWANISLIVGGALVLFGTAAAFWSGGVRENYSNERISFNKNEAEHAKAEAAKANAITAQLKVEAENAKLEQQRLKQLMAWRRISKQQHDFLIKNLKGKDLGDLWLSFVGDDPESTQYRNDIYQSLTDSGIETKYFSGYKVAVGLTVAGPNSEAKSILVGVLTEAGIPFQNVLETEFSKSGSKFELLVGTKPPPF